jgi:hypothetical protein
MRVLVALSLLVLALLLPATALAAAPTRDRVDLNDPSADVDETAWATDFCGFPVEADISGHIDAMSHDKSGPGTFDKTSYHVYVTYRNPANGARFTLRDVGPDRAYVKDGVAYVAVTGRSETGTGRTGVTKIDLSTGEIVHQSGNDIGLYYDYFCDELA